MSRRGENIRKRKDGRWEGRIPYIDSNGVKKYKSIYAHSYRDVKRTMSEYKNDGFTQGNSPQYNMSLDEISDKWLLDIKSKYKYSTYIKYKNIYTHHIKPYIGGKRINTIEDSDIEDIINPKSYEPNTGPLSKSTINSICNVLSQILEMAGINVDFKRLKKNMVKRNFITKSISVLTNYEQEQLIRYLYEDTDNYKAGILIALMSGIRLGELCSLKTENIDLSNKMLSIRTTVQRISDDNGKTFLLCDTPKSISSIRDIPICDTLLILLNSMDMSGEYFLNSDSCMEPRTMQYLFYRYQLEAGITAHKFHSLRHTFATNCINNGMDVKCLSEILGHANVQTTLNRYVHPSENDKRNAINNSTSIYGQYMGQK